MNARWVQANELWRCSTGRHLSNKYSYKHYQSPHGSMISQSLDRSGDRGSGDRSDEQYLGDLEL